MLRLILFLALLGCLYWIYQRDYSGGGNPQPVAREAPTPGPTLPTGGRLGGGLNPFVTDTDIEPAPQRPHVPPIPGAGR